MGVIPTDSYPALVCDLANRTAVTRLYAAKGLAPTKPLSVLCPGFADVDRLTLGFPAPPPGGVDPFRAARAALPGPYTLILHASKALPKQCVDFTSGKTKARRTVGVRMPDHPVCAALLAAAGRPLLCASVVPGPGGPASDDAAVVADFYQGRGVDFVVGAGRGRCEGTTVVDLSGPGGAALVRAGLGDPAAFGLVEDAVVA